MKTKIIVRVIYFTENGSRLFEKIDTCCDNLLLQDTNKDIDVSSQVQQAFELHTPLVFIGAVGIAIRYIVPFVRDKLTDIPVVVIDELGMHVIPILSGHYGGANYLAKHIATAIGSEAVITTATDINGVFAIDEFARINGFRIYDKSSIKNISARLLAGEQIKVKCESNAIMAGAIYDKIVLTDSGSADIIIADEKRDGFTVIPKYLVFGMGCKKGKTFRELLDFVTQKYEEDYLKDNLYAIATIDAKENEEGLLLLAAYLGAKFIVFSADELAALKGDYSKSEFVNDTVGVDNVCERAAVLGAGLTDKELLCEKCAYNGMTLAVAKRKLVIDWDIIR